MNFKDIQTAKKDMQTQGFTDVLQKMLQGQKLLKTYKQIKRREHQNKMLFEILKEAVSSGEIEVTKEYWKPEMLITKPLNKSCV